MHDSYQKYPGITIPAELEFLQLEQGGKTATIKMNLNAWGKM